MSFTHLSDASILKYQKAFGYSTEDIDTILNVYEPYLLQLGFLDRSPRGRVVTENAYKHLGLENVSK